MRCVIPLIVVLAMLTMSVPAPTGDLDTSISVEDGPEAPSADDKTETVPAKGLQERSPAAGEDLMALAGGGFIENRGQLSNDDVLFYSPDGTMWLTADGAWFDLGGVALKQEFAGAADVRAEGRDAMGHASNFFYGNDPDGWHTDVPTYTEVWYPDIYDGIDLRYYTSGDTPKYDLIVGPGADIGDIRLNYLGAESVEAGVDSEMLIRTAAGTFMDGGLYVYQDVGGDRREVVSMFDRLDGSGYGFSVAGGYRSDRELVIDPELEYSTFIGGSNNDSAFDVAVDSIGRAYVTGGTWSWNFPTTPGAYNETLNGSADIFVVQLNESGSALNFATFIGGPDYDMGHEIALDDSNNIYVCGDTASGVFPVTGSAYDMTANGGRDAFVLCLSSTGSNLKYSTYVGGSADDHGFSIAIGPTDDAFVSGKTSSANFPITGNAYDNTISNQEGFLLKIDNTLSSLNYSSFLGGINDDSAMGIDVDHNGNITVVGWTNGGFPVNASSYDSTYNGGRDAFAVKFFANWTEVYSTYVGGGQIDQANDLVVVAGGNSILTGYTRSSDLPTTPGAFSTTHNGSLDVFVTKLNHNGTDLVYSTFIGGSSLDEGWDIALGSGGDVHITGETYSTDFPTTPGAFCQQYNASGDAFFLTLNDDGASLHNSSYLGASGWDAGRGVAMHDNEVTYIAGQTSSQWFPVTSGANDTTYNGAIDTFVVKTNEYHSPFYIDDVVFTNQTGDPVYIALARNGTYTMNVTVVDETSLSDVDRVSVSWNTGAGAVTYTWYSDFPNGFWGPSDSHVYVLASSLAKNDGVSKWHIQFDFAFNFSYPSAGWQDISISARSDLHGQRNMNADNLFWVETRLRFSGTLDVQRQNGSKVYNNDTVTPGEKLTWSGLRAGYASYPDKYPPKWSYRIRIENEEGGEWVSYPGMGEVFEMTTYAPNSTDGNGDRHEVLLIPLPNNGSTDSEWFDIQVNDTGGTNITFSNPEPPAGEWQTTSAVTAGVTITDSGGGVVNGSSIQYILSDNGGISWGSWTGAPNGSGASVHAEADLTLSDGADNFILWRAWDTLGNGPAVGGNYTMKVDTQTVYFTSPMPSGPNASSNTTVLVGIRVKDNTSRVNSSTIAYSKSTDGGVTWGAWTPVTGYNNDYNVFAQVQVAFINGTQNRIRWRAEDIAGTGLIQSSAYTILVNTSLPPPPPPPPPPPILKVDLSSPSDGANINSSSALLQWTLRNTSYTNVQYRVYLDTVYPPTNTITQWIGNTSVMATGLQVNTTFYWKVIPKSGGTIGTCESGVWYFYRSSPTPPVNPPQVQLTSPGNGSTVYNSSVTLQWSPVGGGSGWTYDVYLDTAYPPTSLLHYHTALTSSQLTGLDHGETYYWTVVPNSPTNGSGTFGETVWSFSVNLGNASGGGSVPPTFGVDLISPGTKNVTQGNILDFTVKLKNTGSLLDIYALTLNTSTLGTKVQLTKGGSMTVSANSTASVPLSAVIQESTAPGNYTISLSASSGNALGAAQNVTDQVNFTLRVLQASSPSSAEPAPGGGGEEEEMWGFQVPSKEVLIGLGVGAGILAATAPLWYVSLLFMLTPLMARFRKGKEDRQWRAKIYGAIVSRPGVHFNALKGWLGISNGTLVYNLEMLERDGQIVAKRDGFFKRFYPVEDDLYMTPPRFMTMEDKISIIARDNPGAAQSEIAYLLDEEWHKVHYHVKKMTRDGILDMERHEDGHPRFYLADSGKGREKKRKIFGKTISDPQKEGGVDRGVGVD